MKGMECFHMRGYLFCKGHFLMNGCGMFSHGGYLSCKKWMWEFLSIRGSIFSNKTRRVLHLVNYLGNGCQNIQRTKVKI